MSDTSTDPAGKAPAPDKTSGPGKAPSPDKTLLSVQTAARGGDGPDGAGAPPAARRPRWQTVLAACAAVACAALIGVSVYALAAPAGTGGLFQTVAQEETDDQAAGEGAAPADGTEQPASDEAAAEASPSGETGEPSAQDASGSSDASVSVSESGGTGTGAQAGSSAEGGSGGQASSGTSSKPATVTVHVSIDSSAADGRVSGSWTLTFNEGATVYDALVGTGVAVSSSSTSFGVYVSSIGGLAEKEFGGQSGWKYSVNGSVPGVACSGYTLADGDSVRWFYALGA